MYKKEVLMKNLLKEEKRKINQCVYTIKVFNKYNGYKVNVLKDSNDYFSYNVNFPNKSDCYRVWGEDKAVNAIITYTETIIRESKKRESEKSK